MQILVVGSTSLYVSMRYFCCNTSSLVRPLLLCLSGILMQILFVGSASLSVSWRYFCCKSSALFRPRLVCPGVIFVADPLPSFDLSLCVWAVFLLQIFVLSYTPLCMSKCYFCCRSSSLVLPIVVCLGGIFVADPFHWFRPLFVCLGGILLQILFLYSTFMCVSKRYICCKPSSLV